MGEQPQDFMKITLEWYEQELAERIGRLRREQSKGTKKNRRGLVEDEEALIKLDIEGAAGELAVAKAVNRYWHGSVNAPKSAPDVGTNIQVRATKHRNGSLIITKTDNDDQIYFLVIGEMPNYDVVGYIKGSDGKQEQFVRAPANRPPAFFVPQSALTRLDGRKGSTVLKVS